MSRSPPSACGAHMLAWPVTVAVHSLSPSLHSFGNMLLILILGPRASRPNSLVFGLCSALETSGDFLLSSRLPEVFQDTHILCVSWERLFCGHMNLRDLGIIHVKQLWVLKYFKHGLNMRKLPKA